MNMKKSAALIILLCLLSCGALLLSACDGQGSEQGTDAPVTDTPTEEPTKPEETTPETQPPVEVDCTVTILDQDGTVMPLLAFILTSRADGTTLQATTDEVGKAALTLTAGTYTVSYEALPEGYLADTATLTVAEDTAALTVQVMNNIPNGSADRPFVIVDETTTVTIPAGASVTYVTYGAVDRTFHMSDAALTVTYLEVEYTPDAEGKITVPLVSDGPRDPAYLTLTNASDTDVTGTFTIEADLGSLNNPILVETAGEAVTATVPKDATVYYKWIATKDGVLMVLSETPNNHISMTNLNTSVNSYFTDGTACEYIAVSVGDEVLVAVASKDTTVDSHDVTFSLSDHTGKIDDPVPVKKDTVILAHQAAEGRVYSYEGNATLMTVKGEGVTVTVGDATYEADAEGKIEITLPADGQPTVFTITNPSETRQEITVSLTAPEA